MNKEEFTNFRREVARAFKRRTPNTESLEVLRLVRCFSDPDLRARLEPEFRDMANPERAFAGPNTHDREYMDASAAGYLFMVLHQETGFEVEEHEMALMAAVSKDTNGHWEPEGMD